MARIPEDTAREQRITNEAVVDAYDKDERAMGWYYYLEDRLAFPFEVTCVAQRRISPLREGEHVEVTDLAPADDCLCEIFVEVKWLDRHFGVPLAQLEPLAVDENTEEAIADWHYWVARGYQF